MKQAVSMVATTMLLSSASNEGVAPLGTYTAAERRHWALQPQLKEFALAIFNLNSFLYVD